MDRHHEIVVDLELMSERQEPSSSSVRHYRLARGDDQFRLAITCDQDDPLGVCWADLSEIRDRADEPAEHCPGRIRLLHCRLSAAGPSEALRAAIALVGRLAVSRGEAAKGRRDELTSAQAE